MLLTKIVSAVNKLVGNNSSIPLTYNKLEFYINSAVDHINLFLNTEMHTPSEDWDVNKENYNIIYNNKFLGSFAVTLDDPNNKDWLLISELAAAKKDDMFFNTKNNKYYICMYDGFRDNKFMVMTNIQILALPELSISNTKNYNYTCLPENVIRQVLIYYIAALYLEEEDEFESQYKTYINRADEALEKIRKIHYSSYDVNW